MDNQGFIPRSQSPVPLNPLSPQPSRLRLASISVEGPGRVTATAIRTPEPPSIKSEPPTTDNDASNHRRGFSQNGPIRKISANANQYTSTMSLSKFLRARPKLFWCHGEMKEILPDETNRLPETHEFPLLWRETVTKRGEAKAIVQAAACKNQEGLEEYLAVKQVPFDTDEARDNAEREIKTLKNLCHNHIIAFVGCYTLRSSLGILLYPLAKYNLWTFMTNISAHNHRSQGDDATPHKHTQSLKRYFACLCQALLYLHEREKPIKHRDIKPENILIDNFGSVILTDFDISKEYRSRDEAVTFGPTMCTVRYASKETVGGHDRDLDSDIFSLGCVFLEMLTVILGETLSDLYDHIGKQKLDVVYCDRPAEVKSWIDKLRAKIRRISEPSQKSASQFKALDESILDTIQDMMSDTPNARPTLLQVFDKFEAIVEKCKFCHPSHCKQKSTALPAHLDSPPAPLMKRASDSPQNPMQQPPSPEIGTLRKPMNKPGMNLVHPLETVKEVASNSPLGPRLNGTRTPPEDQLTEPQPEPLTPQRTATDNSAKESDGAVSPNTKFSIPHSRREGRETKTVHPKDNYNRSASPGAIIPSDVIAPTTLPPSSPRALGLTSTSAAPKTQSVSDTGSSQKSLNPISRVDFQESPQTRPSKSMKPPPLPPSTNPNVNSMSLSPPKRSKRHSTASVELTDFRMYDLRKRGKGQISLLQSIDDIPGNDVIEYDPESNICIVKDKRDIARLIQSREADYKNGIFMPLPHGDGWKYRIVTGDLNLWKSLELKYNIKRVFGLIRVVFLKGDYPSKSLLAS